MNWYPWLNHSYRQILSQHQQQRGHHALLIQALAGMGDDALVWGISRWLMCRHPQGLKSCGECHACQLMLAGTHPDWYRLEAEKGKSSLGVDAIRGVTEKLYHHAQQGGEGGLAAGCRATDRGRSQRPSENPGGAAEEYLVFTEQS